MTVSFQHTGCTGLLLSWGHTVTKRRRKVVAALPQSGVVVRGGYMAHHTWHSNSLSLVTILTYSILTNTLVSFTYSRWLESLYFAGRRALWWWSRRCQHSRLSSVQLVSFGSTSVALPLVDFVVLCWLSGPLVVAKTLSAYRSHQLLVLLLPLLLPLLLLLLLLLLKLSLE